MSKERYRLVKEIGKGGFCTTFYAVDEGQFPPVSCVVQKLLLINQRPQVFEQKAQWLEELGQHPQIPKLLAHFWQDGYFYLVQEFIKGPSLAQMVEESGALSEAQIWQILKELLPVLKFISDHNIIHRDIKPANIICKSPLNKANIQENLVLVDFSAAKLTTELEQLTLETGIGSPEYTAPEQVYGKAVFASDLYSLGVTCIYLLTQISPFDLFDIANDSWVWRQYLTTKVSDRLAKILDKLLENSVNRRFQSADEVMQATGVQKSKAASALGRQRVGRLCRLEATAVGFPDLFAQRPPQEKQLTFKSQNPSWRCLHTLTGHLNALSGLNALAISPDGNTLASGDDKNIKLWDLNSKQVLASLLGHSQAVKSVAFSPDGQILATASDDKTIKLWNVNTFKEINTLSGHSHAVKSVTFSPDGHILASGSWDKTIKVWDIKTGAEIQSLSGHKLQVTSVAFSPQSQILASASFDKTIRLWQLKKIEGLEQEVKKHPGFSLLGILSSHTRAVLTVAFSPNGQILATGSDDNTVKLWEINTQQLISTLLSHSWSVVALAFTADSETLISASWDKTVKLWKVSTAEEITTLSGHLDSVSAIAVSPVAQLIISGSRDKTIKLWQSIEQSTNLGF